MGKYWSLRQSFSFLMLFLPAMVFYALQKRSLSLDDAHIFQKPAHFIQENYDVVTNRLAETVDTYFNLVGIRGQNQELLTQVEALKAKMQRLGEVEKENLRLATLLDFKNEMGRKTLAARVISKDVFIDTKSIVIDKGAEDGITRLQAVISPDGAVGYVINVEARSSRVLLLTDRSANIDSTVQRTRARGIVSGVSHSMVSLKYIMRKQDVAAGDIIVTSGRQGYFPKGYIVGSVTSVEPSTAGVSFRAQVKPAADVDKLEEVLILTNSEPLSQDDEDMKVQSEDPAP